MRTKFNEALGKVLQIENYMHVITLAKVNEYGHFDQFRNLTISGQVQFWKELNDQIKLFGHSNVPLSGRCQQQSSATTSDPKPSTTRVTHTITCAEQCRQCPTNACDYNQRNDVPSTRSPQDQLHMIRRLPTHNHQGCHTFPTPPGHHRSHARRKISKDFDKEF